ncbi:MAG: DUF4142 domain-containing protein, partial [Comamonadaceae bacterium]
MPASAGASAPKVAARPATGWNGFAAESARTAQRLPAPEKEARAFLRAAALIARLETEASRLARARGHAAGVLAYSDGLLEYREAADPELLHLLHQRGMAPPMMDNAQRKALNRLGKLQGAKFDREYAELVGPEQQRANLQQYEKALGLVTDPAVRGWIERQLPALRQQQDEAVRQLAAAEKGRGRSDAV